MSKIYKRGDTWWVDFTDPYGRRHRRSTRCCDRRAATLEARRIRVEIEREVVEGRAGIRRNTVAVSDALARWARAVEAPASGYADSYRASLARHRKRDLEPAFRGLTLDQLDRARMLGWRDNLIADPKRTPATVNRVMASMRAFCKWAHERGLMASNPARHLKPLKERPAQRHRALTPAQIEAWCAELIKGAPRHYSHSRERGEEHCRWVRFLVDTGLRQAEAQKLRRSMVYLGHRQLRLPATICKGAKGRVVPLTARAIVQLRGQGIEDMQPEDLVWGPRSRRGAFEGAWGRAKLGGRPPTDHDFRHTAASLWIAAGGTLAQVQGILGHASPTTTARYIHLYGGSSAGLAEMIDETRT